MTEVPVRAVMPRLRNARSSAADEAASSGGTSRGSASTIVTSAPKLRQTLANSHPMTPPPSTMAEPGTRSRRSASSDVSTWVPSISMPGSSRGAEPVASTTLRPVSVTVPSAPSTVTCFGPVSVPRPSTTRMPRLLIRPVRPL